MRKELTMSIVSRAERERPERVKTTIN